IVDIAGQEHYVPHPPAENAVHNYLPLPLKPWAARPSSPAIVPGNAYASSLRNGQRHTGHNHFPRRGGLGEPFQQPLKLPLSQHRLRLAVPISIAAPILPRIEDEQLKVRPGTHRSIEPLRIVRLHADRPILAQGLASGRHLAVEG